MTRAPNRPILGPDDYAEKMPGGLKWAIALGCIIIAGATTLIGGRAWLESYVNARVDARMRDGAFKQEVLKDLNRYLVFDREGAILQDPSRIFGDLLKGLEVVRIPKTAESGAPSTVVKLKFSRYVALQPDIREQNSYTQILGAKRTSEVDWEITVYGPVELISNPNYHATYFMQIYP